MTFLYRFFAVVLATILSVLPAQAVLGPDSIPAVFDQLLKNKNLSNPAMIVIDGSTGAIVYKKNAYQQRKPASVMKILTGAVMLEHLDPLATFSTTVGINPELGTVVIKGSYDPWMSPNHTIARKMNRASLPHIGTRTMNSVKEFNGGSLQNYKVMDAKGVEAVFRDILFKLEVDDSQLVVADASGLSRKNKITAKLMGELLYKLRKDEKYALIYAGLPVGGVSGTLETRFLTTAPTAVGLVKAKTGTLNGTATLAGYVQSTDREYVFVTLADEIPGGNTATFISLVRTLDIVSLL